MPGRGAATFVKRDQPVITNYLKKTENLLRYHEARGTQDIRREIFIYSVVHLGEPCVVIS